MQIFDYAFYIVSLDDVEVTDATVIDSGIGILSFGVQPNSVSHAYRNAYFKVEDSLFIGYSDSYDCDADKPITAWSPPANWGRKDQEGHIGLLAPIWGNSGPAFGKPWDHAMSYNTIRGTMYLNRNTFANFDGSCGLKNSAIRTHHRYEDMNFPIVASTTTYINTPDTNYVYFDPPGLGVINPSDCVDMPCDALKKFLIIDTDGTLSGSGTADTTIIPDNSFEWDGDRRYGMGYYRVPRPMVTDTDGNRIAYDDIMANVGIVQNNPTSCTAMSDWNGFHCAGVNHRLLVIESLDVDTEIRRLSPIGVLAEDWIDLINGPQDHGWCFGYTCQERLSTFHAIVAPGITHEIHMTSTPPLRMRYHLLNANAGEVRFLNI